MISKETKILLIGSNIWYLGEGMLGPLFAIFAEKIGGNILEISWAWAIYLIVTGVAIMIIGKISDSNEKNYKKKKLLMILGYALNAVFTFSYLLVDSSAKLFIVQIGLGIAAALAIPTWSSLYAIHGDKKRSGYEWGLVSGNQQILTGIALLVGGLIVNYLNFQLLFIIMGSIQIIATIYQAKIFLNK